MKIFLSFLLLIFFFNSFCRGDASCIPPIIKTHVRKQLELIPSDERFFLEKFLYNLIKKDGLGYTLFGSKPVCLGSYFCVVPFGNIFLGRDTFVTKKGWKFGKKYENYFPHPHYLIFEESQKIDGQIFSLFILLKKIS